REVDRVRAELRDVVEVMLDPTQVPAEKLERRLRSAAGRQVVPGAWDRPLGDGATETARGESVRKDLIDDRAEVPVGAAARCDYEVVTVGHLVRHDAEPVQPRVADVAARARP